MKNKLFLRLKDLVQKENRARLAVLLGAAAMLLLLLSLCILLRHLYVTLKNTKNPCRHHLLC